MHLIIYTLIVISTSISGAVSYKTLRSPAPLSNFTSAQVSIYSGKTARNSTRIFDVLWLGWDGASQSEWEYDYLRELFPAPYFRHTNHSSSPSAVTCRKRKQTNVIGSKYLGLEAPSLIGYLLGYKPAKPPGATLATRLRTVIHLGDEDMGLKPDKLSCVDLFPHVPLALRQYALPPAASSASDGNNVFQIPLGYMVGYLRDNKEEPPSHTSVQYARWSLARNSSARSMKWSFVGGFHGTGKSEREHAIKVFSGWTPHVTSSQVPPEKLRHVYNDSLFVISGRGHVTLDCFRVYEATIAGAIPIVVGPIAEINHAFYFDGEQPPFLYASSWEGALKIAMKMSATEIDAKRAELVRWYINRINYIRRKIQRVFGLPPIDYVSNAVQEAGAVSEANASATHVSPVNLSLSSSTSGTLNKSSFNSSQKATSASGTMNNDSLNGSLQKMIRKKAQQQSSSSSISSPIGAVNSSNGTGGTAAP